MAENKDNEEKDTAPFSLFMDNKLKKKCMYVQNSTFEQIDPITNKSITEKIILVRYIGGHSMCYSVGLWNFKSPVTGRKRFEKVEE